MKSIAHNFQGELRIGQSCPPASWTTEPITEPSAIIIAPQDAPIKRPRRALLDVSTTRRAVRLGKSANAVLSDLESQKLSANEKAEKIPVLSERIE